MKTIIFHYKRQWRQCSHALHLTGTTWDPIPPMISLKAHKVFEHGRRLNSVATPSMQLWFQHYQLLCERKILHQISSWFMHFKSCNHGPVQKSHGHLTQAPFACMPKSSCLLFALPSAWLSRPLSSACESSKACCATCCQDRHCDCGVAGHRLLAHTCTGDDWHCHLD